MPHGQLLETSPEVDMLSIVSEDAVGKRQCVGYLLQVQRFILYREILAEADTCTCMFELQLVMPLADKSQCLWPAHWRQSQF